MICNFLAQEISTKGIFAQLISIQIFYVTNVFVEVVDE
jgi:hypothetical protein